MGRRVAVGAQTGLFGAQTWLHLLLRHVHSLLLFLHLLWVKLFLVITTCDAVIECQPAKVVANEYGYEQ